MFHEIIVELFVGSMDVMPITKFNTMFDADHINSVFPRQVSAVTFFAQGSGSQPYFFESVIGGEEVMRGLRAARQAVFWKI
jgi:hypothetical protein